MEDANYSIAVAEVLNILENTDENDVRLIPKSFINFLKSISDTSYIVQLDHSKTLEEMNLKDETKGILGVIYRNWWCTEEEKEYYKRLSQQQEIEIQEELKEKYNIDNLFVKKQKSAIVEEEQQVSLPAKYEKQSIFIKIINRITSILKK